MLASVGPDRAASLEPQQPSAVPAVMQPIEAIWRDEDARARKRWATSLAIVLGLHVVPLLLFGTRVVTLAPAPAPPPAAIMIDMAPALPPHPLQRQVEPVKPPPIVKTQAVLTPLPRVPEAAATLASDQHPVQHPVQHSPEMKALANPAPAPASSPPTQAAVQPQGTPEPSMSAPNWQSLLLGRLERFKRYPADAQARHQQGVTYLHFTMDRNGRVLSYRLEQSSGYDLLDQETLALIQRAQPLPKPPSSVPGNPVDLVVPIEFSLKQRW